MIKNVVFDIGNVMVRWSPAEIIRLTFGDSVAADSLASSIFQSELWLSINRGEMSEEEAKACFEDQFDFSGRSVNVLFYYIKQTQIPIYGSLELLQRVKSAGYAVYALTDNVNEIVAHLKLNFEFWPLFDGAIVSAEVGCLKPYAEIFNHLISQYAIRADESVFIDDVLRNVQGASAVGFGTIHFHNALQCEGELKALGVVL